MKKNKRLILWDEAIYWGKMNSQLKNPHFTSNNSFYLFKLSKIFGQPLFWKLDKLVCSIIK